MLYHVAKPLSTAVQGEGRRRERNLKSLFAEPEMRVFLVLSAAVGLAQAAISLDGPPAVAPASPADPSALGDINEYVPDRHDCPPPCGDGDLTNMNTWIRYHSVQRLERCGEPMGETCVTLAARYKVKAADVIKWNPAVGSTCTGMWAQTYVCVGVL